MTTFGREVRKITDAEMRAHLAAAGCEVVAQYGGRCANDLGQNRCRKATSGPSKP